MSLSLFGQLLSLLCALLWALAVMLFKRLSKNVSSIDLNLIKNLASLILFSCTLPLLGISFFPPISRTDLFLVGLSGALGLGLADLLFFMALSRLKAGLVAIVDCLYSPFMILLSVAFLDDPVTPALLLGVVLVAAAIILAAEKDEKNPIPRRVMLLGVLLAALSMLGMAGSVVMIKPIMTRVSAWWVAWFRLLSSSVLLSIILAADPGRKRILSTLKSWKTMLLAAFLGTYLATAAWLFGLHYSRVSIASVLNQTSTIFILLLAWPFLKEPLTNRKIVSVMLAFVGAATVIIQPGFLSSF